MTIGADIHNVQLNTAMKSPAALKAYLRASGKQFITLQAEHLVDALWPSPESPTHGIEALQQIVSAYRDHRRTIPSGYLEKHPSSAQVPVFLDETLSLPELEALGRWVAGLIREEALRVKAQGWIPSEDML